VLPLHGLEGNLVVSWASEALRMEVHPGVFVSSIDTVDWRFDPEVGGEMHVLVEAADGYAGMSRFVTDVGPEAWTLPEREILLVLEGAARIEVDAGPTLVLKAGDMASIPKGAVTRWQLELPYKELWFFARPYDMGSPQGP
jgi:uncharacterized cupin superfamily protein